MFIPYMVFLNMAEYHLTYTLLHLYSLTFTFMPSRLHVFTLLHFYSLVCINIHLCALTFTGSSLVCTHLSINIHLCALTFEASLVCTHLHLYASSRLWCSLLRLSRFPSLLKLLKNSQATQAKCVQVKMSASKPPYENLHHTGRSRRHLAQIECPQSIGRRRNPCAYFENIC